MLICAGDKRNKTSCLASSRTLRPFSVFGVVLTGEHCHNQTRLIRTSIAESLPGVGILREFRKRWFHLEWKRSCGDDVGGAGNYLAIAIAVMGLLPFMA